MSEQTILNQPSVALSSLTSIDHDLLIKLSVQLETVLIKIASLDAQIKDMTISQASTLTTQDVRIRKLEDAYTLGQPWGTTITNRVTALETDMEHLKENKSELRGGWKTIILIIGIAGGLLGGMYSIIGAINFFTHICMQGCK